MGPGHRETSRREPVVPPAIFLHGTADGDFELLDQPVDQHALDGSVERPRSERQLLVRDSLDVLHDGVAVRFSVRQRHHDLEDRGRHLNRGDGRRLSRTDRPNTVHRGYNHYGYM